MDEAASVPSIVKAQTTHTIEILTHTANFLLHGQTLQYSSAHKTANMGRVRTKTVKKSAKVIIEYVLAHQSC